MIQKLTNLSKVAKAIIIPNKFLKDLNDPEAFDMQIVDGKIVLIPLEKKKSNTKKPNIDQSIDLYSIG